MSLVQRPPQKMLLWVLLYTGRPFTASLSEQHLNGQGTAHSKASRIRPCPLARSVYDLALRTLPNRSWWMHTWFSIFLKHVISLPFNYNPILFQNLLTSSLYYKRTLRSQRYSACSSSMLNYWEIPFLYTDYQISIFQKRPRKSQSHNRYLHDSHSPPEFMEEGSESWAILYRRLLQRPPQDILLLHITQPRKVLCTSSLC